MQDFHVIEKEQVVPSETNVAEEAAQASETESLPFAAGDDGGASAKKPVEIKSAAETEDRKRAAQILLGLVASMAASQLLILALALLIPRQRMVRIDSIAVSEPGTLVLKREGPEGIDFLFIFFHPIPALLEVTQRHDKLGLINWCMTRLSAGVERALQLRDSLGHTLLHLIARLVASRPYQQAHRLFSGALERLRLPV